MLTWRGRLWKDGPALSTVHPIGRAYWAGGGGSILFYKFQSGSAPEKSHAAHFLQARPDCIKSEYRGTVWCGHSLGGLGEKGSYAPLYCVSDGVSIPGKEETVPHPS